MLVATEAQGVHETENHGVGTPTEAALGRVQLWKDVGRNASIDQVLENFESAGGERNGTIGVKRSGATVALDDRNDHLDFQADGTTAKRKTRLKKESRR